MVVEGFWNGLHRSPYHGFSVEFTEYRQYSPGDDTRYLDWRLYARSDRYYLKKFEDETNLRCHLLVDQSRSMSYGSLDYSKVRLRPHARRHARVVSERARRRGRAVHLCRPRPRLSARAAPARTSAPAHAGAGKESAGSGTNLGEPLRRVAELARKRGLIVLISDLLAPVDELERDLGRLTAAGHEVVVFQVLDPNELAFNFRPAMFFKMSKVGKDFYLDPEAVRSEYQRQLASPHRRRGRHLPQTGFRLSSRR